MTENPVNIALIDDDESLCKALGRLLRLSGFDVRTFPSAEEYLAQSPSALQPLDLVVTDIQLGGMSGLELQAQLRHRQPDLPVIIITAHDGDAVCAQARSAGCAGYLRKPFLGQALIDHIRQALDQGPGRLAGNPG